jgi:O-methyltransferase
MKENAMGLRSLLRHVLPEEWQVPTHLPRRILAASGYFRLRTWLANRGATIPDSRLYQPLFSPWEGAPDFEAHYQAIRKNTLVSRDRCHVLWRTLQQSLHLPGDVVECGVFRGGTALLAARTIAEAPGKARRELHLFDTFQGMPDDASVEESFCPGAFGRTSVAHVRQLMANHPFTRFHVGYIPDTFVGLELEQVAWAHVDLDLYKSIHDAIDFLYPRLVPGGILVFDDYGTPSCPGARRAIDEAFADKPEVPLCLPTGQAIVFKIPAPVACSETREPEHRVRNEVPQEVAVP